MKFKFLLFLTLLATTGSLWAQTDRTFESMGYDDQTIIGINGSLSYFLKVKPDDNVDQSRVILHIRKSQVLNPNNSVVVVYMKDQPVYTQRITASVVDTVLTMVIPMSRNYLQPDGRFIKMKVASKLSISDEYCKDVDNPACWITVRNTSFISEVSQSALSYQRSVKEWVQEFSSIYTPVNTDLNDLTSGGILYTLLKQNAVKNIFTGLYHPQDSAAGGIITGVVDKLPGSVKLAIPPLAQGQGLIMMARVTVGSAIRNVLVITGADDAGYKKAISVLASNRRISSAFSDKVIVNDGVLSDAAMENASPLITSLEDLGGEPILMEGIGGLKQKYNFSLTEFNAIPTKLTLHLESFFSVLKADDRGFLNIYLNQNLVYNSSLIDKNNFIGDIDLKPYLLSKFNSLEIEFRFHPGTNICKDGFSNFFAFINTKSSNLTFSGEKENKFYSFFNFPAEFRKVPTKIVISPALYNANIISSVGELLYQLNSPIKNDFGKLIVPQLVASDKTSLDELKGFNLIALLQSKDAFVNQFSNLPVKYNRDFQLYKDSKGDLSYSINDFSNSGMAQIFREKGSTVLLVTALGDSSYKEAFESVIKNFSTQLTEIESNVCIANSNGISNYFFKMPEDSDSVRYKGANSRLATYWESYKYWVMIVLLGLLVLSIFFLRGRVRKSQDIV